MANCEFNVEGQCTLNEENFDYCQYRGFADGCMADECDLEEIEEAEQYL